MVENQEEISLDYANNVLVGPNGYFRIVIDEFDGTTVKAWHLEDSKGNSTLNLSDRGKGQHIDLLVNARCRTVAQFVSRIMPVLMSEQQAEIRALKTAK